MDGKIELKWESGLAWNDVDQAGIPNTIDVLPWHAHDQVGDEVAVDVSGRQHGPESVPEFDLADAGRHRQVALVKNLRRRGEPACRAIKNAHRPRDPRSDAPRAADHRTLVVGSADRQIGKA